MTPTRWTTHERVAVPKATVLKRIKFLRGELDWAVQKEMRSADRVLSMSYFLPIDGSKPKETRAQLHVGAVPAPDGCAARVGVCQGHAREVAGSVVGFAQNRAAPTGAVCF